ncbi:MAG: hypothetical protein IT178_20025 [Acidobacteria bacterium]|nr:hypothetical protein [Acidobacteriota bacterium]
MLLLLILVMLSAALPALAQPPAIEGVGFDETLDGEPVLLRALSAVPRDRLPKPLTVRLSLSRRQLEPSTGQFDFAALDARLEAYRDISDLRILLDLGADAPDAAAAAERTRFLRALSARYRGRVQGYVLQWAPPGSDQAALPAYAFHLKSSNVDLRAGDPDAVLVLGGLSDVVAADLEALYRDDIAPYIDGIAVVPAQPASRILAIAERDDPGAFVVMLGATLGSDPAAAPRRFTDTHVPLLGTKTRLATYAGSRAEVERVLPVLARLSDLLSQGLVPIDEAQVGLRFERDGKDVTSSVPHVLVFGLRSLSNYLIYTAEAPDLSVTLTEPSGVRPQEIDALSGTSRAVAGWTHDAATNRVSARLAAPGRPVMLDWNSAGRAGFVDSTEVTSAAMPSLAEIVSRHQQARAAQDEFVRSYIADAHLEQHFRATAADLAFDVVTENTFYVQGREVEFEEREFRLNGTRWGADRPPFPLLQAEKVLSLPLDLRLTSDYTYRLAGIERVEDREAFAIRFDPVDESRALYRGTVWIDRATFHTVKVQTVQTSLEAPVLSSEEIQFFGTVDAPGGRTVTLMTRLIGRQSMLIAGRNLLLEREMRLSAFDVNAADFVERRDRARASEHIMYRDTDEGLRYLVLRDGARVVDTGTTTTATALLLGVIVDPAYDFPLPMGGLNHLDFEFLGKGNQLAVTFGGVLALANVQRPNLIGKSVDGSVDLFAIAVPGSDRLYTENGEDPASRVRTIPFTTGATVGWRFAEFNRLVGNYQFRYDWYGSETATAPDFTPPQSTATNGLGVSWEWKRGANALTATWTGFRRAGWRAWGRDGDYDPAHRDYAKYSLSASKVYFTGFHKVTLNAAYYGGRDLDRFSKYQFGLFDENRIRGVPSAGVRFGELAMLRGAYSFNLFDLYRIDLFLDQAMGRDRALSPDWQPITGTGVAFSLRGPRNTMVRGDIGKSFMPGRYRKPGTIVFQIQVLKPL